MKSTLRNHLKTGMINLLTSVLLALILEFALFLALNNSEIIPPFLLQAFRGYYLSSDRHIIQVTECGQYDSTLFYTLKPGSCTFSNREFSVENVINSQGLRDDETSLHNPRVIVLGDSYTMGWGVRQEETFSQLLEQQTGQRVLNAGMSSYGTAREIKMLSRLSTDSLKYVIVQYHENDYEENLTAQKNNFILPVRSRYAYDSLRHNIHERSTYYPFKHLYGISKSLATTFLANAQNKDITGDAAQAKLFLEILRTSSPKTSGIQFLVFKVGNLDRVNDRFADAIDSLVQTPPYRSLDIETVRLSDVLTQKDYFILDDHINKNGHAKIANAIVAKMAGLERDHYIVAK